MSLVIWRKPGLILGIAAALGLLAAAACGAQEATPTATATPPPVAPTATNTPLPTATPTTPAGVPTKVVATPTPVPTATPTPIPAVKPKRGGIVRQSGGEDPPSFDAHTATSSAHVVHNALLYSNLVWRPDRDQIVTDAAESFSVSADGKTWTFKLRPNVKFHAGYSPAHPRDGTAMTSRDVKWSLEKIMGFHEQLISARSGWMKEFIDIDRADTGIEVVDDLTFKVHLIQPFPGLADILAIGFSGIMPEGIVTNDLKKRPYGSGPFRLKDFQRGAIWRYERNAEYFKPGVPYLDGIHHINMDGAPVIQAAFLTGKLDLSGGIPTPDNEAVFKAREQSGEIYTRPYVTTCRPQGIVLNAHRPPFSDLRLRQAVNLGIDRQAYTQVVHDGYAEPHYFLDTGGVGRTREEIMQAPGYRQPHDKDQEEAKKIVQELFPGGLDLKMMTRNSAGYMRQGEFISGELKKIGINATIDAADSSVIFSRATKLDFDIWAYWFCLTTESPEELFGSYFVTGGSRNWSGYSNPDLDKGFLDMAATTDPAQHRQKALALEDIIMKDLPIVPLVVHSSLRMAYTYVRDLPLTKGKQYTWPKNELIWRSDL